MRKYKPDIHIFDIL